MKAHLENFRQSSIQDVIKILRNDGIKVVIYEPMLKEKEFCRYSVIDDLAQFKEMCDVIIANRCSSRLEDVKQKLYTRDIFCRD